MRGILYRYESLFPVGENTPRLSLCEGDTPLIPLLNMSEKLGVELHAKFEGANPTGSFKDRGMVLAVTKALEAGARAVVCASTGNTSAAAAAYAARAGIPCYVILPAGKVARGKLAQALAYGARVIAVKGNFDRALEMAREAAERKGLAIVNSVNPYRLWGQRSGAWEICDELGDAPDWLAIPVGNAGNITAYWTGFHQYHRMGKTGHVPRMMGFQAEGAAPMVKGQPVDNPETIATAIRIGHPVNAPKAAAVVRMTEGAFQSVSDAEILAAQKMLASSDGVFAEPASCAGVAGLIKMKERGELPQGIRIAVVLTGNGLKDPDVAIKNASEPVEIEGTWEALEEVLER